MIPHKQLSLAEIFSNCQEKFESDKPQFLSLLENSININKFILCYPGAIRGTEIWDQTYKIRSTVEQSINHFKDSFCISGRKTQNEKTLHADLLLAGITELITVVLADKIHNHHYIRSLKPLIV
jgi:hypothetical protein